jgi:hypothetical protein
MLTKFWLENPERKRSESPRYSWENNIKMDLKDIGRELDSSDLGEGTNGGLL